MSALELIEAQSAPVLLKPDMAFTSKLSCYISLNNINAQYKTMNMNAHEKGYTITPSIMRAMMRKMHMQVYMSSRNSA